MFLLIAPTLHRIARYVSLGNDADGRITDEYSCNFAHAPATDASVNYDDNGNRTTNPNITSGDNTVSSSTDRVLYDGTYYYTYDPAGNRTAQFKNSVDGALDTNATDITIYAWNDANELTSAKHYCTFSDYQSGDSDSEVDYAYDFSGEMVERTEGGASENYVYDGQDLALVLNSSGGVVERELSGPAVDQVLASEDSSGNVNWLLTDNEGSVRDVVQNLYGTDVMESVDHIVYDGFGEISWQSSATDQPRFTYAGMRYDAMIKLYYDTQRWYSAVDAVFASQDPLGFGGGDTNTERYCANSPTNATDPTGTNLYYDVENTTTDSKGSANGAGAQPSHETFTLDVYALITDDKGKAVPAPDLSKDFFLPPDNIKIGELPPVGTLSEGGVSGSAIPVESPRYYDTPELTHDDGHGRRLSYTGSGPEVIVGPEDPLPAPPPATPSPFLPNFPPAPPIIPLLPLPMPRRKETEPEATEQQESPDKIYPSAEGLEGSNAERFRSAYDEWAKYHWSSDPNEPPPDPNWYFPIYHGHSGPGGYGNRRGIDSVEDNRPIEGSTMDVPAEAP